MSPSMQRMYLDTVCSVLQELAGLQVGMETVHTGIALRLVRLVGVTHAPSIVAVNDGRLVHFKGYITAGNLKQFLKSLLPNIVMVSIIHTPYCLSTI